MAQRTTSGKTTAAKPHKATTAAGAASSPRKRTAPSADSSATIKRTEGAKSAGAGKMPSSGEQAKGVESAVAVDGEATNADQLKRAELYELVAEKLGLRKNKVREAVDATLEVLGEALASEREMNLQPFGRLSVKRSTVGENATAFVTKIRRNAVTASDAAAGGNESDDDDD